MIDNIIKVGMADLKHTLHPGTLTTLGLGSCVGIALYDTKTKIIGLAHIMLPWSAQTKNNANKAKFMDTGIELLINNMTDSGAVRVTLLQNLQEGLKCLFSSVSDMLSREK